MRSPGTTVSSFGATIWTTPINRAAVLARIESEGVTANYFVNPHSEYYNPFEAQQVQLLRYILGLGHSLALHFDAAFHNIQSEEQLHCKVAQDASWLEEAFGVRPDAFSFHNPGPQNLQCSADHYGGLINCYSHRFKTVVPYCSDSNGYWRFRRLHDVLIEATDSSLQVLTHPGWWQHKPMPPRQRIFRSAYGRAAATMRHYDHGLEEHGRLNHSGPSSVLVVLKCSRQDEYEVYDFLWNNRAFKALFVELWRQHEMQMIRLSKAQIINGWLIPLSDVNAFFVSVGSDIDGWCLFEALFDIQWFDVTGISDQTYKDWADVRRQLIHAMYTIPSCELEQGCVYLCELMKKFAAWGLKQSFKYDGLADLSSTRRLANHSSEEYNTDTFVVPDEDLCPSSMKLWSEFKERFLDLKLESL